MMNKTTWIIFAILISLNIPFFILGLFDIFDGWPLYQIPLFQIEWLALFANNLGINVFGKANEFAALPNLLGWILILIGSSISLIANGLISGTLAAMFTSKSVASK